MGRVGADADAEAPLVRADLHNYHAQQVCCLPGLIKYTLDF